MEPKKGTQVTFTEILPENEHHDIEKIGTGHLAALIFVAFTALGCALAALILAIKG